MCSCVDPDHFYKRFIPIDEVLTHSESHLIPEAVARVIARKDDERNLGDAFLTQRLQRGGSFLIQMVFCASYCSTMTPASRKISREKGSG